MKFCVVGAGAIGGLLAARLGAVGNDVHVIARGETLAAITRDGLTVNDADGTAVHADVHASDDFAAPGAVDAVILAVKAHQIAQLTEEIPKLYGPTTIVVPVQNGVPWWFFQRFPGPYCDRRLEMLDPDGSIAATVPAERIVASIAYPAAERAAPNVIDHIEGDRFPVGELDGSKSDRAAALAGAFSDAGFKSRVVSDIRATLWVKAWGNLAFNPISALTGSTLGEICANPATRVLASDMMLEALAIAEQLGVRVRVSVEKRIQGAEDVGDHRTSMLQDRDAARPMEIDPLVGAFVELGRLTSVPTPAISAVYALVHELNRQLTLGGAQ